VGQENYVAAALELVSLLGNFSSLSRACFTGDTQLMARGAWGSGWKRIDQISVSDEVLSRDENNLEGPLAWKMVEEVFERFAFVAGLHVGGEVIKTTLEHPFFVHGKGWTAAGKILPGDFIASQDGQWLAVERVSAAREYFKVYNLRIESYHTYFVGAPTWGFSIWAHNACNVTQSQLQKKFKHAIDFGVTGNSNTANLQAFENAIQAHVNSPATQLVVGTYHGNPANIYVNSSTGLAVITDTSNNFVSGWKLSAQQLWHVLNGGKLGGG
jgi:Colicin D/Pretoxin HINT domain